jgi:DNA-binding Lrp family transcriptional regulator
MSAAVSLDRIDFNILVHLQREGRCSNVDLADAVGLSASPCLLRTRRLQEIGLIRGFGADIALNMLGEHVIVFAEITLGSHQPPDFRVFEQGAEKYREIIECYNVSGGYDYLLKIVAPGVGYFQALMDKMLEDDIGIERFACRIVLRQSLNRREYPLSIIANQKRWA